jgi:type II secretory ATPase GspE/PulE/Tfp pilus assembly ATPase PilB-like protein
MTSEGLTLRTRWFGREFVPFDEVAAIDGTSLRLASGALRAVPPDHREDATRALSPPPATGALAADGATFAAYVTGAWSPVRAARTLIAMAEALGASDVHVEADGDGWRARVRITGDLADFARLPPAVGARLVAALKHVAGCLPYRSDRVQEGRIPRPGVAADVRASFLPTALGERVALRLFGRLLTLDALGLPNDIRARLTTALDVRAGLVLVAGPSGAGKTTTLYALLAELAARRGDAHLSLEDPVEQRLRLAGVPVDQVELDPPRGLTAEAALVGALRQDVDVLAVGEIRTAGEAALALEAAHTGRVVLAGLHAGTAREAIRRMLDLGADRSVLDETLLAVLHQHLTTVACTPCAGAACACRGLGRRRSPVAELWMPGDAA